MQLLRVIAAAMLLVSAPVEAQTCSGSGITVSGTGVVLAQPDMASVSLGVSVKGDSVAAARALAATTMQAVIDSIKANGVAAVDIMSTYLSVTPQSKYLPDGSTLPDGYLVTNTVTAIVRDVNNAGTVVDGAIAAGGNYTTVSSIDFGVVDPSPLQSQARQAAVQDAKQRAETLADASDLTLGAAITIVEAANTSGTAYPMGMAKGGMSADSVTTPVMSGQLTIEVDVTVTYAVE